MMVRHSQPRQVDAVIIGNELTGYLLGAALSAAGLQVVILELQGRLESPDPQPATLLCAPMLSSIHAAHGQDTVQMYALQLQQQLLALTSAAFPYVQCLPAYTFARTEKEAAMMTQQHDLLIGLNLPASITTDSGGCPFPAASYLMMPDQALVNVSLWKEALRHSIRRRGGQIQTDIQRLELDEMLLLTEHGRIHAQHVILTTGLPLGLCSRKHLALLVPRMLVQCHLNAPWPLSTLQQSPDSRLQLLPTPGGASALWDAGRFGSPTLHHQCSEITQLLSSSLPDWQVTFQRFCTQVISADGLPVIGVQPGTNYLFASGLDACPILGAMHAADTLTRRILGKAQPADRMYEPDRHIPKALLRNIRLHTACRYAMNVLRPLAPFCPHCGCKLRYFPPNQLWTCALCGSGYTAFGQPVCGPGIRAAQITARQRPV